MTYIGCTKWHIRDTGSGKAVSRQTGGFDGWFNYMRRLNHHLDFVPNNTSVYLIQGLFRG